MEQGEEGLVAAVEDEPSWGGAVTEVAAEGGDGEEGLADGGMFGSGAARSDSAQESQKVARQNGIGGGIGSFAFQVAY